MLNGNNGEVNNAALMIADEYRRVRFCHKKISKLVYGNNGLIQFLYSLFAFFGEKERAKSINFHFALKEQVEALEDHEI